MFAEWIASGQQEIFTQELADISIWIVASESQCEPEICLIKLAGIKIEAKSRRNYYHK